MPSRKPENSSPDTGQYRLVKACEAFPQFSLASRLGKAFPMRRRPPAILFPQIIFSERRLSRSAVCSCEKFLLWSAPQGNSPAYARSRKASQPNASPKTNFIRKPSPPNGEPQRGSILQPSGCEGRVTLDQTPLNLVQVRRSFKISSALNLSDKPCAATQRQLPQAIPISNWVWFQLAPPPNSNPKSKM
jgi:hypothetical protein